MYNVVCILRYGFNGQEQDDEVHSSTGTSYDYGARMYDPRLGRWMSTDPKYHKYAYLSPYSAFGNCPLYYTDGGGETLKVGGNKDVATKDVLNLLPAGSAGAYYRSYLQVSDKGEVSFNIPYDMVQASGDKGVELVYNLVNAKERTELNVANNVISKFANDKVGLTKKDMRKNGVMSKNLMKSDITDNNTILIKINGDLIKRIGGSSGAVNSSKTPEGNGGANTTVPLDSWLDGQVTLPENAPITSGSGDKDRKSTLFHELSENYYRTTENLNYDAAHAKAVGDEKALPADDCRRDYLNEGGGGRKP